ncbi:MAG: hypothetical protein R3E01_36380 [Pirellulaceae bacterium]|nr:hypothetical protein [Planctomycetales bacterium]
MTRRSKQRRLMRWWYYLSADRRRQVRSWYVSIGINCGLLIILCLVTFQLPHRDVLQLTAVFGEETTPDAPPTVIQAPLDEEEEEVEPVDEAAEETLPETDEDEMTDVPTDEVAPDSSTAVTPQDLDELDSDAARLAETERRVRAAGGNIDAPITCSLGFTGDDDVDLHVYYQGLHHQSGWSGRINESISYQRPRTTWGFLDVDANAKGVEVIARYPCENIAFAYPPHRAAYSVFVHHFYTRGRPEPTPYVVVVKCGDKKEMFSGEIFPGQLIKICEFTYQHTNNY